MARKSISDSKLTALSVRVGKHLRKRKLLVATAESCTGGWISKVLTDIPGSSQWVLEGFVTYSNEAKTHSLGVSRSLLKTDGSVSERAARAMALGALKRSGANVTVAVTGIAGPGGAVPGKPVGTVWLGWAIRSQGRVRLSTALEHFRGDRDAVRRQTVQRALTGILAL